MVEEGSANGTASMPKRIVMTGFRATGKSAVGVILAERLKYKFVDTDEVLCQTLQCSVAEYVSRHGWTAFREKEKELLAELANVGKTVIATGGGAIQHLEEWAALRENSLVVWLQAGAETIRQRLQQDSASAEQRPSLTGANSGDEVDELLKSRTPLYDKGSDMSVDTTDMTPQEIVNDIVHKVSSGSPD